MKTHLPLTLSSLLLFVAMAQAQLSPTPLSFSCPFNEAHMKNEMRSFWNNGQSNLTTFMHDVEYREAFGISEEQFKQYTVVMDEFSRVPFILLPSYVSPPLPPPPPVRWDSHEHVVNQFQSPFARDDEVPHTIQVLPAFEPAMSEWEHHPFILAEQELFLPPAHYAPDVTFFRELPADWEATDGTWNDADEGLIRLIRPPAPPVGMMQHFLGNVQTKTMDERNAAIADALGGILTPQQQQKMLEAHLVAMQGTPNFSPHMFEALGLTDAQRQEMWQIKEEMEPEFERFLDEHVRNQVTLDRMMQEEFQREFQNALERGDIVEKKVMTEFHTVWRGFSQEELRIEEREITTFEIQEGFAHPCAIELTERLLAEDPEFRRIHNEIQSRSMEFSVLLEIQMAGVLTDEQWERLQELTNNPPEHARFLRERFRMMRGIVEVEVEIAEEIATENERGSVEREIWVPGPDSWRPGMPLPETFRPPNTSGNFPRPR